MEYWMIMIVLGLIAAALVIAIIVILVKDHNEKMGYDDEDDDLLEEDDEDEDEDEYEPPKRRRQTRTKEQKQPAVKETTRKREPAKKQWKIILENLDTWEKYTFIFYDNIGIGRGNRTPEFEKYIMLRDDPRVSKLHCAIIRNGDRLYLKDLDSRNGTYLNGKEIQRPIVIQREDVIEVGETKIEVKKILRERD